MSKEIENTNVEVIPETEVYDEYCEYEEGSNHGFVKGLVKFGTGVAVGAAATIGIPKFRAWRKAKKEEKAAKILAAAQAENEAKEAEAAVEVVK